MPRKLKTQAQRIEDYMKAETYLPKWMRGPENRSKVFKAFEAAPHCILRIAYRLVIMDFLKFMGERGYKLKKVTGDMKFKIMEETLKPKVVSVAEMLEARNEQINRGERKRRKGD